MRMKDNSKSLSSAKYDFVFPIGAACSCTSALRYAKLQFRSLPFDWLWGSTLVKRSRLFESGFADWLTEAAMECVGEQLIESIPKLVYKNNLTEIVFNRDFPLGQEFQQSYPVIKEKYNRRISRLLECIKSSQRVLAVYIDTPDTLPTLPLDELVTARNTMAAAYPGTEIHILYLHNDNNIEPYQACVKSPAEGIFTSEFCYSAHNKEHPHVANVVSLFSLLRKIKLSRKNISIPEYIEHINARKKWIHHVLCSKRNKSKTHRVIKVLGIPVYSAKITVN